MRPLSYSINRERESERERERERERRRNLSPRQRAAVTITKLKATNLRWLCGRLSVAFLYATRLHQVWCVCVRERERE
jgi:hypothetical protein